MFRALTPIVARWRPLEGEGLEHLNLTVSNGKILAESVVIGERGGSPYGVRYRILCNADWCVLHFLVESTEGDRLEMNSDGAGHWVDSEDRAVPKFDGCIDIDLAGSPFTNTLPIRRMALMGTTGPVEHEMLYVPFDTFIPVRDRQRYTCLEPAKLYRYEAVHRTFKVELPVDEDGLVIDYPTLFRRLPI